MNKMKLSDINLESIDTKNTKIKNVLSWHISRTEDTEELFQIDLIEVGLNKDKEIGTLTKEEYNKARVMFCDIALNYFKNLKTKDHENNSKSR